MIHDCLWLSSTVVIRSKTWNNNINNNNNNKQKQTNKQQTKTKQGNAQAMILPKRLSKPHLISFTGLFTSSFFLNNFDHQTEVTITSKNCVNTFHSSEHGQLTASCQYVLLIAQHLQGSDGITLFNWYQFAPGGTQLWVGYGCAARSFDDHHPITKPEKTQICNLYLNHLFLEGYFLKPSSTFYHVNWDT